MSAPSDSAVMSDGKLTSLLPHDSGLASHVVCRSHFVLTICRHFLASLQIFQPVDESQVYLTFLRQLSALLADHISFFPLCNCVQGPPWPRPPWLASMHMHNLFNILTFRSIAYLHRFSSRRNQVDRGSKTYDPNHSECISFTQLA